MAPTLYMTKASPPCRAIFMTAKAIGLDLNLKELSLLAEENKTPEFLKLNPQHTVPTLVDDDGFVIWDSHAIIAYLITKYAKDDSLYPKDAKKRAVVDQRLHFDSGVGWANTLQVITPLFYQGVRILEQKSKDLIHEVYGFTEAFLNEKQWIAGDSVTIADFSTISTITSLDAIVKVDGAKYPKLAAYLKRSEGLTVYDANKKGLDIFAGYIKKILG